MLHIPSTNYLLAAKKKPKNFLEKSQENGPVGRERKRQVRRDNVSRQKNERGDSKLELNGSPEISLCS